MAPTTPLCGSLACKATSGSMVMVDGGFHAVGFGKKEIGQEAG